MTLKYLLMGGLVLAVVITIFATGGLSACNILDNTMGPTPTPSPKAPATLSPIERISSLESQISLLERSLSNLQDRITELEEAH